MVSWLTTSKWSDNTNSCLIKLLVLISKLVVFKKDPILVKTFSQNILKPFESGLIATLI